MTGVCNIPADTICNECLYEAKVIVNISGFPKYLCFRCYSLAMIPPKKKPQSVEFVKGGRGVLPLTGTGR